MQWTVTTTTHADSEKVETRELAGPDSIRQNGSGTFPVYLSLDEDHARGLRRFEFKLENGVFVSSVRDSPLAGETPPIASLFEGGDANLDLLAVRRCPDRLDLVLGLQEPDFEVFATGQYKRRK